MILNNLAQKLQVKLISMFKDKVLPLPKIHRNHKPHLMGNLSRKILLIKVKRE